MAGLNGARRALAAAIIIGSAFLALAGCENALTRYLLKGILYQGWKVANWSPPVPVVEADTASNGFPMNVAIGGNGKLHLVCWKVNDHKWVYNSLAPGASAFNSSYLDVNSTPNPDDLALSPGIDLVTDDTPIIAYGVGDGFGNHDLLYQEYNSGLGIWGSEQPIASNPTYDDYAPVFVSFFSTDFKSHIWYLESGTIKHTIASPPSPSPWFSGVGKFAAVRLGPNEVGFAYTDTTKTQLFYRTWTGAASPAIWTAPSNIEIGQISIARDSNGAVYVCVGTSKPLEPTNSAFFALYFFTNAGGTWREIESITGNSTTGPMYSCACAMDVAQDRYGNDHLHMVYTVWAPPLNFSIWYTYYDEAGWHAPQNLDTVHSAFFPLIAVDPAGTVHVVYSWYKTSNDRTTMYVRGTPGEPQNQ
jgi:hypothetical protein